MNKFSKIKKSFLTLGILGMLFFASQAVSRNIQFKTIEQLPEEHQSILAVRKVKPSVVSIIGRRPLSEAKNLDLKGLDPLVVTGGTGFIIDSKGYIVTNNHVIATKNLHYSVELVDGRSFPARVVGSDKFSDIAVLKIAGSSFPAVTFGDSDTLETGQTVFAIGNALGRYQNTVTKGVVSGLFRAVDVSDSFNPLPRLQDLIQTDAAINPGNSGGPLVDITGEVVGMNTVIDSQGQNIGFAIPVNTIKKAAAQLESLGKFSRPRMGILYRTIDDTVRIIKGWPENFQGALVLEVAPLSPSAAAGILKGDVITEVDKKVVTDTQELDLIIRKYEPGNQILITLLRNGKRMDLPLILGEFK